MKCKLYKIISMHGMSSFLALSLFFFPSIICISQRSIINGTTHPTGFITDGDGQYSANTVAEWLIIAPTGYAITLQFSELVTECSFDYVFVYDGRSQEPGNKVLATISGSISSSILYASSGHMLIVFFTDQNANRAGFNATYRVSPCPNDCRKDLNHKHTCVGDSSGKHHYCDCIDGNYEGVDCSIPACPENCGYHQSRGACKEVASPVANKTEHFYCECEKDFFGETCILEKDKKENYQTWTRLYTNGRGGPVSATGTDAVVVTPHRDILLYTFGGYDLTNVVSSFFVYNVSESSWSVEEPQKSSLLPPGRAFHTMTLFDESKIAVIGGVLTFDYKNSSERMENNVWVYDITLKIWSKYNSPSTVPGIADHTATLVGDEVFVIGGRLSNDTYNDLIYVLNTNTMTWSVKSPRGFSGLLLRRVGHSAVYDEQRKTLLVFGGYMPSKPNFSKKSGDLLAYSTSENYLSSWETVEREKGAKPDNLAQHSAVIMGNYMVVFGGSMRSDDAEGSCVMNETFLFHLDCHMWINKDKVLIGEGGEVNYKLAKLASKLQLSMNALSKTLHAAPPRKGHVAVLLDENLMAVYGGYDGTVRSDIYVYKAPPSVFDKQEEGHCREASRNESLCHLDPKCVYCPNWLGGNPGCLSPAQLQERKCASAVSSGMCPGVCGSLTDCMSCLIFGDASCSWCPATQTCQNRSTDSCKINDEEVATPITLLDTCKRDYPMGFVQTTFYQPENPKFPDYLQFSVAPDEDLFFDIEKDPRYEVSMRGPAEHSPIVVEFTAKLSNLDKLHSHPKYQMLLEGCNASFTLFSPVKSLPLMVPKKDATGTVFPIEINSTDCNGVYKGCGVKIRLELPVVNRQGTCAMTLYWNGESDDPSEMLPMTIVHSKPYEFLAGGCATFESCLSCTGNGVGNCGWNSLSNQCQNKFLDEKLLDLNEDLVLYPHQCTSCLHFVDCHSCNAQNGCVWARTSTSVQCLRKPPPDVLDQDRKLPEKLQKYRPELCSKACHERSTCEECFLLNGGNEKFSECSWCSSLKKCMPFYMYLPAYSYGVCKSYSEKNSPSKCAKCSEKEKCSDCLSQPGCGFCEDNGSCVAGNFDGPLQTCGATGGLAAYLSSTSSATGAVVARDDNRNFHFTKCPKRDECEDPGICDLQIKGSFCVNTDEAYRCDCPPGEKEQFVGDGSVSIRVCQKTCKNPCGPNGVCHFNDTLQDFECVCDKGYFGDQCQFDCDCNKRSHCKQKGECLQCDEGYKGDNCGVCKDGWYKIASGECRACSCNGNGDPRKGFCDKNDGKCFCVNNTDGDHCEKCKESAGYYSKPSEGNICYKMCTGWAIMSGIDGISYIGSEQGDGAKNPDRVVCIWQISTKDDPSPKSPAISGGSKITFEITALNVECNHQYVYVYENTPSFLTGEGGTGDSSMTTDNHQRDKILGAFCGKYSPGQKRVVEAESTITVVFKANVTEGNQFFNARITVHKQPCSGNWVSRGDDSCECPANRTGWNCDQIACPNNCSSELDQGSCVVADDDRLFCSCKPGFTGDDCSRRITHKSRGQWTTLLPGTFAKEAKYGRLGHTIVADKNKTYLYIIGGRNFVANPVDMLKYSIEDNKLTTVRTEFLIIPYRGYYHASAITDSGTVYVFGGLQQMDHKCSRTFWHFIPDAKAQIDNKLTMSPGTKDDYPAYSEPGHSWIPTVARHTMNYVRLMTGRGKETVELLIIIGGYSPEHGFNNYTLQYNIQNKTWSSVPSKGTKPVGIFGHSTVYYERWNTFYIYGGYVYSMNSVLLSKDLYALTYKQYNERATWSLVTPKGTNSYHLTAIAYHQAVLVGEYMVVLGGRTESSDFTNEVRIYLITCNFWILEGQSIPDTNVLNGTRFDPVIGHSAVAIDYDIYIYGGFNGVTFQSMHKLSLPEDICKLQNGRSQSECERILGCSFCKVHPSRLNREACGGFDTCCFNSSNYNRHYNNEALCERTIRRSNNELQCFVPPMQPLVYPSWPEEPLQAPCSDHKTCTLCLSDYWDNVRTTERGRGRGCKWDSKSERCVDSNSELLVSADQAYSSASQCTRYLSCHQSDCRKCLDSGPCVWSRYLQHNKDSKIHFAAFPIFPWGCYPEFILQYTTMKTTQEGATCPAPCHSYENCSSCLESGGADGGWKQCYWAQELNECISPTFAAMQCAAGECGRVVRHSAEGCPKVCEHQTQCSTCAQMTHCGWCSLQSGSEHLGLGACWEGGLNGPRQQRCTSDSVISYLLSDTRNQDSLGTYILFSLRGHSWSHSSCPPEDECENNHHNCDPDTEQCHNLLDGFECRCKKDYLKNEETGKCEPQCDPPCSESGKCIEPNQCQCNLGFTGPQCDKSCPCHGHSECSNDTYKPCKLCQHNTAGLNCGMCKQKFYGNATISATSDACRRCYDLCNRKTEYCVDRTMYEKKFKHLEIAEQKQRFEDIISYGPETTDPRNQVVCIMCSNHTSGDFCEQCQAGFYKDRDSGECVPCQCNGHARGNKCDPLTGLECQCLAHTESPDYCKVTAVKPEHLRNCAANQQCSTCESEEFYIGEPADGRQCYRLMESFLNTFFIDPDNEDYDNRPSVGLKPGQASFFFVEPDVKTGTHMHRVVIEVFNGSLDLYVGDDHRMVKMDQSQNHSEIMLFDSNGNNIPPTRKNYPPESGSEVSTKLPTDSSLAEFMSYSRRSRRASPPKVDNSTVKIHHLKNEHPKVRESVIVMTAEFNPEKNAMYVKLDSKKTILIAANITGRFEVLLPVNEDSARSIRSGGPGKKYFFTLHNSRVPSSNAEENGAAVTGIIYRVESIIKLRTLTIVSLIAYAAFLILAATIGVYLLYLNFARREHGNANQNNQSVASSRPLIPVDFHYLSQIDPLPGDDKKKPDIKSKYLSLQPKKNSASEHKSMNINALGRQLFCAKWLCVQPFRNKKEAPCTVMFETPICSGTGQRFFFGTAICQFSSKTRKSGPEIVPGHPIGALQSQSMASFRLASQMSMDSLVSPSSVNNARYSTLPNRQMSSGASAYNMYSESPFSSISPAPNFGSLSRRHQVYGARNVVPRSGSMASPPVNLESATNTINRSSISRNSMTRSQTFSSQRSAPAATPHPLTQVILNSPTSTSFI